jgi:hypothetical protein
VKGESDGEKEERKWKLNDDGDDNTTTNNNNNK